MHNTSHQKAFTSVELIIAIVIIGIITSVATISIGQALTASRLRHTADRLVADLRNTRDLAMRDQKIYTIVIIPTRISYITSLPESLPTIPVIPVINYDELEPLEGEVLLCQNPYQIESIAISADDTFTQNRFNIDAQGNIISTTTNLPLNVIISITLGQRISNITITNGGHVEQIN